MALDQSWIYESLRIDVLLQKRLRVLVGTLEEGAVHAFAYWFESNPVVERLRGIQIAFIGTSTGVQTGSPDRWMPGKEDA